MVYHCLDSGNRVNRQELMPNPQTLSALRLAVSYVDGYIKVQSWLYEFIRQTDRLVFDPMLMQQKERNQFNKMDRDWRKNPCLVRYRTDSEDADYFCERGTDAKKRRGCKERGQPLAIEFQMDGGHPSSSVYHCDQIWLKATAALVFHHAANYNPASLAITRVAADGSESGLNIPLMAITGPMTERGKVGESPCGYNQGVTRATWG
jgi:hypothetical protein